jgi:hypothetical protein
LCELELDTAKLKPEKKAAGKISELKNWNNASTTRVY